ncbi:MAG: hypothetical protein HC836_21110 [Richelia sp. RM2_1_2]|nr:hypothetical protein [Richelia sp. SM1_7_0]NJN08763.1 hypothetical protein [Richelia sp. RM1_1_1]NJO60668.1 hypothetical protein [Richelia sp. RM2_1_2]
MGISSYRSPWGKKSGFYEDFLVLPIEYRKNPTSVIFRGVRSRVFMSIFWFTDRIYRKNPTSVNKVAKQE